MKVRVEHEVGTIIVTVNVTTYSSSETRPESSDVSMKGFIINFFPFPFH